MERACFYLRIFPGTEAEYDRRHAEIWPELVDEIRESGLRNMSGFRRGTDVWYYVEARARREDRVRGPRAQARQPALEPLLPRRHRPDHRRRRRPALVRRGLPLGRPPARRPIRTRASSAWSSTRSGPTNTRRSTPTPWPDMMAAIEESGFRNYTGFRRGAHVVYYGEFYPDMETVFATMGPTRSTRAGARRSRGSSPRSPTPTATSSRPTRSTTRTDGASCPSSADGPDRRVGVISPYWTLWEHTAGPTFRADRLALARARRRRAGRSHRSGGGRRGGLGRRRRGSRTPIGATLAVDAVLVIQTMAAPPA